MNIVDPAIESYLGDLQKVDDEPVLLAMEELAERDGFPIVGRLCGRVLEVMARSIGAKRIFELGSGFGFSAYWFARATGPEAEIHLTDRDPINEERAMEFLTRAGLATPIRYHVGDAFEAFDATTGDYDIVFCDIDKEGYPEAWRRAKSRIRVGGLYISDNMLWSGRVADSSDTETTVEAVRATNAAIAEDPAWRSFILPTRDGVVFALRLR